MKVASLFVLLAAAAEVWSKPLIDSSKRQVSLEVGEPVLHQPRARRHALDKRQVRTTNLPMNPPPRTTTTPSTTTTTTTTKATTTTTTTMTTRSTITTTTTTTTRPTTTTTTTTRSTTTTTTTTARQPTQTINVTGMTYLNAMLTAHNVHRPNHTEANLVWNQTLANIATSIGQTCNYQHNTTAGGGGYGQNIGAGAAGNAAAGIINNLMYNGEINNYPQPYGVDNVDLSNFGSWGHYSQLMWSDTTSVGCATVYCPQGLKNTGAGIAPYFTVCNYYPPGNYVGRFSRVKAPQGGATVVIVGS